MEIEISPTKIWRDSEDKEPDGSTTKKKENTLKDKDSERENKNNKSQLIKKCNKISQALTAP